MTIYRMAGVDPSKEYEDVIMATHPAATGTFIVYAHKDGTTYQTPVVLWGVTPDAVALPITMSGVWDGVTNANNFVIHPNGYCTSYDQSWAKFEDAVADAMTRATD